MIRARLVALVPLGLVGLVGLAPAGLAAPSYAADLTCQGLPVTIAGDSATVTGTEGRDVIAASTATTRIDALGGDDVICAYPGVDVEAGAGSDSVLATAVPDGSRADRPVVASLGAGDDTYVGWAGADWVDTVTWADRLGADTISTGGGSDIVGSGARGEPNDDVVDLGAAPDDLRLALPAGSRADLRGGPDGARTTLSDPGGGSWAVDLRGSTGTISRDVPTPLAVVSDLPDLRVELPAAERLDVRGNREANTITLAPTPPRIRIDLKQGRDLLDLQDAPRMSGDRVTLGGQRHDEVTVSSTTTQRLALGERRVPGRLTLAGVHTLSTSAAAVDVLGSDTGDDIRALGCRLVLDGRGGADTLVASVGSTAEVACAQDAPTTGQVASGVTAVGARLFGGSGDDRLRGSNGFRDRLVGGPGRDVAKGATRPPFGDVCRAEKTIKCG